MTLKCLSICTPELKDLNVGMYQTKLVCSLSHATLAVRSACVLMADDSNYMNNKMLHRLSNTLLHYIDVTSPKPEQYKKEILQHFYEETAHVVNSSNLSVMATQAVDVLNTLAKRPELENFDVTINEKAYNEAQRNLANSKAGRTGLDAFKL